MHEQIEGGVGLEHPIAQQRNGVRHLDDHALRPVGGDGRVGVPGQQRAKRGLQGVRVQMLVVVAVEHIGVEISGLGPSGWRQ